MLTSISLGHGQQCYCLRLAGNQVHPFPMKNVFVFGADTFNLAQMQPVAAARGCRLHPLYRVDEVKCRDGFPVERLHKGALEQLEAFRRDNPENPSIDAIVGYWDFPVSTMLPLLRAPFKLPSPTLAAVLKCEHKYWSRLIQQSVVPRYVPDFCAIDPFCASPRQQIPLAYPFWIKPVKAASSYLGFRVANDAEFEVAIEAICRGIHRFASPFNYLLSFVDRPAAVASIDGNWCIAEAIISEGRQCTLEGYVHRGQVVVYGAVDSIREGRFRSSFSRYQYPSRIPRRIQQVMTRVTRRVMIATGFNQGPFNIEFYWSPADDRVWLLEINTRISKSHIPLFRDVDGASHQQVMLDLALGQKPVFPHRQGSCAVAAKFMWRVSGDAIVTRVPTHDELAALRAQFPSAEIQFHVHEGMRLSELTDQDSYSYEIALIYLGADSQAALLRDYAALRQQLHLLLEPVTVTAVAGHQAAS